ncbi:SDR family oxidoreductase [Saccharopolyspora rhizosphaerae]|uniref:SDR family oxidoreductase n=1 Tax=Saccharopolyspora rhizosphaerae TaxID=2492662 RepID=A0A3R8P1L6_9PSEU|nr:SDR family oxidoreductase [Saccharopolyspora rhizosphaerae]RRO14457.1 SDR family oxidoreductase [Saccharopolyspora rhizosphaerae]
MSRHVLVTGAASGLGRAIAAEFADNEEVALTLVDVDGAKLAETPVEGERVVADLTSAAACTSVVQQAGPLDVLVNAAGIYPSVDMADVDAEIWDRVFDLNVRAPALTTAAFARQGRSGAIINISSGAALRARPGGGPYASSKAALEMATRAAALELGERGIRVNAVSPGFVAVDSDCNPVADDYAAAVSVNPLGRPGAPADIARAVRWLASENASWITGEVLRVDGGSSAGAFHLPRLWPNAVREGRGA